MIMDKLNSARSSASQPLDLYELQAPTPPAGRVDIHSTPFLIPTFTRHIFADFDGTTVQTLDAHTRSLQGVFSEILNTPIPQALVEQIFKNPPSQGHGERSEGGVLLSLLDAVREHTGVAEQPLPTPQELVAMRNQFVRDNILSFNVFTPSGITALLQGAVGAGISLSLCTNSSSGFVMPILEHLGLHQHFMHILTSDSTSELRPKPLPDMYLSCLKQAGQAPGHCLVLEDSATGAIAALRANLPVLLTPLPHLQENIIQKVSEIQRLEQLTDTATVLHSWSQVNFAKS